MNRRELSTQEFRRRDDAAEECIHHSTGWRSRRVQRGGLDESSHHDERSFRRQRILEAKRQAIVGDRMDELRSRRRIRELAKLDTDEQEVQAMVEKARQERAREEAEKLRHQEEAKRLRIEQEEADKQRRIQRDAEIQRQEQLAAEASAAAAKTKRKRLRRVIRRRIIKRKLAEHLKHPPEPAPVSPEGSQERQLQLEVDTEHHPIEPLDAELTDSESYVEVSVGSQYDSDDLPDNDSEEPLPDHLFQATRDWDTTEAVPPPPDDTDLEEETVVDDEDDDDLPQQLTEEEEMEDFMEFIEDDQEIYEEETEQEREDEVYEEVEELVHEEIVDEEVSLVEEVAQDDHDGDSNLEEEVFYEDSQGNLVIEEVTEGDPVDEEEFFETIRAMNTEEELAEDDILEQDAPDELDEPENDYPSETEEEAFQREQDELLRLAALKQQEEEEELRWEEEELAREAEAQRLAEEEAKQFDPNYALNQMLQSRPSTRPRPVRKKKQVDEDNVLEHEIGYRPPSLLALVNKAKTELRPPPPEEHKKQFVPVVADAASLGRVVRLNEKVIEANGQRSAAEVNTTKTDSSYAVWAARHANRGKNRRPVAVESRSNAQIMVNEAAAVGKMKSGRQDVRDFDHLEITERKIHIDDLGDAKHDGAKVFRTGHLIDRHVEDKLDRNDWTPDYDQESYSNLDDVSLPSDVMPVFRKHETKKSGMNVREELSREVAEGYWNRYYRLERPGANLVVTPGCFCKYCKSPNAWQTYAYQKKWAEERLPHEESVEGHDPESLGYIARLYLQDPDQPDEIEFDDLPDEDAEQKRTFGGLATDGTSSVDFSLTSLDRIDESDDDISLGDKLNTEGTTEQTPGPEKHIESMATTNNEQLNHGKECEDIPVALSTELGSTDATVVASDEFTRDVQSESQHESQIAGDAAMLPTITGIQHVDNVGPSHSLLDDSGFHAEAPSDKLVETDTSGAALYEKGINSERECPGGTQLFFSTEGHMELASIPSERHRFEPSPPSQGAMSPRSARKQRRFRPLKWIKKTFGGSQKHLKTETSSGVNIQPADGVTTGVSAVSFEAPSDAIVQETSLRRENDEVSSETCPVGDSSPHIASSLSSLQGAASDFKEMNGEMDAPTSLSPKSSHDSEILAANVGDLLSTTPSSEGGTSANTQEGDVALPVVSQEMEQGEVRDQQIPGNRDVRSENVEENLESTPMAVSKSLDAPPLGSQSELKQGHLVSENIPTLGTADMPNPEDALHPPSCGDEEKNAPSADPILLDLNEDMAIPASRNTGMDNLEARENENIPAVGTTDMPDPENALHPPSCGEEEKNAPSADPILLDLNEDMANPASRDTGMDNLEAGENENIPAVGTTDMPDPEKALHTPSYGEEEKNTPSVDPILLDLNEDTANPASENIDMGILEARENLVVTGEFTGELSPDRVANETLASEMIEMSNEPVGEVQSDSATKVVTDSSTGGGLGENLAAMSSIEETESDKCDIQVNIAESDERKQVQPRHEEEESATLAAPLGALASKILTEKSEVSDQDIPMHVNQESDDTPKSPHAVKRPSVLDRYNPTENSASFASPGARAAQEVIAERMMGSPAELTTKQKTTSPSFSPALSAGASRTVLESFLDLHNAPHVTLHGSQASVSTLGDQTASAYGSAQGGMDGDSKSTARMFKPRVSPMSVGDRYRTASPESVRTSPPKLGRPQSSSAKNQYIPIEKASRNLEVSGTDGASSTSSSFRTRMKAYLDKSDPQSVNSAPPLRTSIRTPLRKSLLSSSHSVQDTSLPSLSVSQQNSNDSTPIRSTPKRGSLADRYIPDVGSTTKHIAMANQRESSVGSTSKRQSLVLNRYNPSVSPSPQIRTPREGPKGRSVPSPGSSIQSRMKAYLNSSRSVVSGMSTRSEPAKISTPRRSIGISSSQSVKEADSPSKHRTVVKRGSVLDRYRPFEAASVKVEFAAAETVPLGSTRSANGISSVTQRYIPSSGPSSVNSAPVEKRQASVSSSLNARMQAYLESSGGSTFVRVTLYSICRESQQPRRRSTCRLAKAYVQNGCDNHNRA